MKSLIALLALLAVLCPPRVLAADEAAPAKPAEPAAAQPGLRFTVTVTKFENEAGWEGKFDLGTAWGAVLTDLLNQSGRFIVLGEKDMRAEAMAEQDFGQAGRTAGGKMTAQTGQLTPAQLLVKGTITHVQDSTTGGEGGISFAGVRLGGATDTAEINVTIYIVDATTAQVVASKSVVGKAGRKGLGVGYTGHGFDGDVDAFKKDNVGKAVTDACGQAVEFMTSQLPKLKWTGTVVIAKAGKIYINRGTREGVATGQEFVVGKSEVVRDPDSGEVLDETMEKVARIKADTVKEKLSICSVIEGEADKIEKGMGVQAP